MDLAIEDCGQLVTYHKGRPTQARQIPLEERRFIAWDGEGINLNGAGKPQSYILFGCSTGDHISKTENIHTFDIMDFMLEIGELNVGAVHIGFAFNYDANMILRTLREKTLIKLHEKGSVYIRRPDSPYRYRIEWRPSKWFQVSRFNPEYSGTNTHAKTTVRVYDIFSFFNASFIKAYEGNVGPVPELIEKGKAKRPYFTLEDLQDGTVLEYWSVEVKMMQELAEELRKRLYGAGLRINQWHGPGALASYAMRQHNVKEHMLIAPDEVRKASRFAYAGGRFEMYSLGRHHGPIYSMDINSAYPHAIRLLPSLQSGTWVYNNGHDILDRKSLNKFGVYRIRMQFDANNKLSGMRPNPSPLFHRDALGNITYPWRVNGWYWYPEAIQVLRHIPRGLFTLEGGWELETDETEYPFGWVEDVYNTRQEWKSKGYPSQLALKLLLNSMYGKLAQRVGWNEDKRTGPAYHQLEWAGWVTSNCRAMLWDVMRRIPYRSIIAVETDGLYTTTNPATLGITNSKELGGWEIEQYDEILYVQSGLAWLRKGNDWICKRRGLDARTFELNDCVRYLSSLGPRTKWAPYRGETTRFIGLGAALQSKAPTKVKLGVWETKERDISPGLNGKRLHIFGFCRACTDNKTAYESAHDMMIKPIRDPNSSPHDIPWEDDFITDYPWRAREEEMMGLVVNHG
jgi:hypothetical protein